MPDTQSLRTLITTYLQLVPAPADFQVHALAEALACDKESLEALIYKMLGETTEIQEADPAPDAAEMPVPVGAALDTNEVLQDDFDPDVLPLTDVALNDGSRNDANPGYQEETLDDGLAPDDRGRGFDSIDSQNVLIDDGVPIVDI